MITRFATLAALVVMLCAWPSSPPFPTSTIMLGAISSISTTGGSAFLTMSSGLSAPQCAASSPTSVTPATTLASTSTSATLSFPPMAAGTYTLVCSNADTSVAMSPNLLTVSSVTTPSAIFGANLVSEYLASTSYLTCTGGCTDGATVTAWADVKGTNNLTCTGGVTYHKASTHWIMPNIPIVTFDGTSGYCSQATFALGSNTIYELGGFYPTSGGYMVTYSAMGDIAIATSTQLSVVAGSGSAISATVPYSAIGNGFVAVGGVVGTGTSWAGAVSWSNGTVYSSSGTAGMSVPSTGDLFEIGARNGGTAFGGFETSEVDVVNTLPSSTQRQQYVSYVNLTQGVDALPALSAMTTVQASTSSAPARIRGKGFNIPTVTVADGVGVLTGVNYAQTYLDLTTPSTAAGTHDVTIANPDGRSVTFNDAATWSSPTNPTPEMILGDQLDVWLEGTVTLNGSNVSTWKDLSGLGNDALQATALDQPSYTASDSIFGGRPSVGSTGSPTYMLSGAMQTSLTGTSNWLCTLSYETTASNGPFLSEVLNSTVVLFGERSNITHTPFNYSNGGASWGSGQALSTPYWACSRQSGTGTVTSGQNINNGTEVTATSSSTPNYTPLTYFMFSGGNTSGVPSNYWGGHIGLAVLIQGDPTLTQLTQLHAYACAGMSC